MRILLVEDDEIFVGISRSAVLLKVLQYCDCICSIVHGVESISKKRCVTLADAPLATDVADSLLDAVATALASPAPYAHAEPMLLPILAYSVQTSNFHLATHAPLHLSLSRPLARLAFERRSLVRRQAFQQGSRRPRFPCRLCLVRLLIFMMRPLSCS